MELKGYYITDNTRYDVVMTTGMTREDGKREEILLGQNGIAVSAYLNSANAGEFCYSSKLAKKVATEIKQNMSKCTSKNATPTICKLGTASQHVFKRGAKNCNILMFDKSLCGLEITTDTETLYLEYAGNDICLNAQIPYVKISTPKPRLDDMLGASNDDAMDIPVRTLEEIALEKDVSWLQNKKYYVVNNEAAAEKIFSVIENWNGPVSYDTETSGLKINMFCKIGSQEKRDIEKYNQEHPGKEVRTDYLVGIIFCVEPNISYYFPCANRKFKNLYSDLTEETTAQTVDNILAKYTVGEYRDRQDDMAVYIRNTPKEQWGCDVILMERVRKILETRALTAHNGVFEWKVSWCYNIDINLKDDTMVLHKLMYKFRSTTSNKGEPSDLKYLSKVELGVDQLELTDFFVGYSEDDSGKVRDRSKKKSKKKKVKIDFSYMDYAGTKAYAPADGDLALQILFKYKSDLKKNFSDLEYLYNVEILVSCAIAYMEFYGHRIREDKIKRTKEQTDIDMVRTEHKFRALNGMCSEKENALYEQMEQVLAGQGEYSTMNEDDRHELALKITEDMKADMKEYRDFNIGAPGQVAALLYGKYDFKPDDNGKMTVNKKYLKQYVKMKNEDGSLKYPEVSLYLAWKDLSTLQTKFFDNLPDFMYPGGFLFSSYGQISTATGRMSCSKPNAQQYPKAITAIVIPRDGFVHIDADFSQIEYRTLVGMAQETELIKSFEDPDSDYHTTMASRMYGVPYALVTPKMRSDAKSFNFGIPYGMGFKSLAILLTGRSGAVEVEEAKEKYEMYFKDQPKVRKFFDNVKEEALVNKYTSTYFARKRYYSFTDKDGKFSNKKRGAALRQAGNAVIQGSSADIFKIAVARNFSYIRKHGLLGTMIIINMVHDEILFEINSHKMDVRRAVVDIIDNMQMEIAGFPPLFVGAGVGADWKDAKGKFAEIHPLLGKEYAAEFVRGDAPIMGEPADVIKYFDDRAEDFAKRKINAYITDVASRGQTLNPVIGNILGLRFDYGAEKDFLRIAEEKGMSKEEQEEWMKGLPLERLKRYIEKNGFLGVVDPTWFGVPVENTAEEEEEEGYDDEDEDELEEPEEIMGGDFALIDEDDKFYGVDINTIIRQFGLIVSHARRVCGIDVTVLPYRVKEDMVNYIEAHSCDQTDPEGMEVVFLRENNLLFNTGVFVKGINASEMNVKLGINSVAYR